MYILYISYKKFVFNLIASSGNSLTRKLLQESQRSTITMSNGDFASRLKVCSTQNGVIVFYSSTRNCSRMSGFCYTRTHGTGKTLSCINYTRPQKEKEKIYLQMSLNN